MILFSLPLLFLVCFLPLPACTLSCCSLFTLLFIFYFFIVALLLLELSFFFSFFRNGTEKLRVMMVSYDGMSHTYKVNYYNHRLFVVISFGFPGIQTMLAFQLLSWSCLCNNLVDILVWALIFKLLNLLSPFQFVASITNFELFSLSEVYSIQATKAGVVLPMDKHTLSHPEGFP